MGKLGIVNHKRKKKCRCPLGRGKNKDTKKGMKGKKKKKKKGDISVSDRDEEYKTIKTIEYRLLHATSKPETNLIKKVYQPLNDGLIQQACP